MTQDDAAGTRFAVRLTDLERDAHVPWDELRTEAAEAPNDPPLTRYDLETQHLFRAAAIGYW